MSTEEVNVIALVENLELAVPRRLPIRLLPAAQDQRSAVAQQHRVIELTDRKSKLALERQFDLEPESTLDKTGRVPETEEDRASLELLRKLPPGTVLIKQIEPKEPLIRIASKSPTRPKPSSELPKRSRNRTKKYTSDHQLDPSAQPLAHLPPRRPLRRRSEIRRNPMRTVAARKDPLKELRAPSSRQRLLAARRRCPSEAEPSTGKRCRAGYMSTRSVTRKQGNVGATYEAPTWRDQAEWKEWPVHGMHERPVYHPQLGLAAEYNGRLFASFGGEGYREISSEPQIEIVRVDPRAEALDHKDEDTPRSSKPLELVRYVRQQSAAAAAARQVARTVSADKPRLTSVAAYSSRAIERLHTLSQSLGLVQRLGSRIRLQPSVNAAKCTSTGRLLSKEVIRTLQSTSFGQMQQASLPSSSKCLVVPRNGATPASSPLGLPFCEVQAVKTNSKGKLIFVKAPETPKKLMAEKTSTITSASQGSSVSWAEVSLRKRPDGTSTLLVDVPRTFAGGLLAEKSIKQRQALPAGRGYPPVRLAEATSIFRAKVALPREDPGLMTIKCNGGDFGFRNDDQQDGVLDLSKKEGRTEGEAVRGNGEIKGVGLDGVLNSCTTDLVHYFQNFGADENIDLFEDPKNLT